MATIDKLLKATRPETGSSSQWINEDEVDLGWRRGILISVADELHGTAARGELKPHE